MKILCIVGPTASGKSELAIELALKYGAEILSCDARQIYKRLDIGSNKVTLTQQKGVPHWGIDIIEPDQFFTVQDYETYALSVIEDVRLRGKNLIICGGTGFYLKVLEQGLDFIPEIPSYVREELIREWQAKGIKPLLEELKSKDAVSFSSIDIQNPRRVLRALEVIRFTQRPFSQFKKGIAKERNFTLQKLGIALNREELYQRINLRTLRMLELGLLNEVDGLLKSGLDENLQSLQTIGYKEAIQYLKGKLLSYSEMVEKIQQHTRNYAKRQLTWWGKDTAIRWMEATAIKKVRLEVESWR
jgi:tRNA dimethylallyltransferase